MSHVQRSQFPACFQKEMTLSELWNRRCGYLAVGGGCVAPSSCLASRQQGTVMERCQEALGSDSEQL